MEYLKDLWNRIKADLVRAHKSWTMVLNGLCATLGSAWVYLQANPDALSQTLAYLPQLDGLLSPKVLTVVTIGINLLNMALRVKTSGRLADKA